MREILKNKRVMLIALLIALVLVTGSFIGTIARYVTKTTVSQSARVAKFGLNVPETIDLFKESYGNVAADTEGNKIIAPGTEGKYEFAVSGTSEVAYEVSANVTLEYSEEWNDYEPLQFSTNGTNWTDFATFKAALETALSNELIAPNAAYDGQQEIHWKWPYSTGDADDDANDTAMGAKSAVGPAPTVTVTILVTATQVD